MPKARIKIEEEGERKKKGTPQLGGGRRREVAGPEGRGLLLASAHTMLTPPQLLLLSLFSALVSAAIDGE